MVASYLIFWRTWPCNIDEVVNEGPSLVKIDHIGYTYNRACSYHNKLYFSVTPVDVQDILANISQYASVVAVTLMEHSADIITLTSGLETTPGKCCGLTFTN